MACLSKFDSARAQAVDTQSPFFFFPAVPSKVATFQKGSASWTLEPSHQMHQGACPACFED